MTVRRLRRRVGRRIGGGREQRTEALAAWHLLLLDKLAGTDAEDRLDRLARHPALRRPELQFLKAQLRYRRGDFDAARRTVHQCLENVPQPPQLPAVRDRDRRPAAGSCPQDRRRPTDRSWTDALKAHELEVAFRAPKLGSTTPQASEYYQPVPALARGLAVTEQSPHAAG
jgi:hypothetical protein